MAYRTSQDDGELVLVPGEITLSIECVKKRKKKTHLRICDIVNFSSSEPFISEVRSAIQVDRSNNLHIGYTKTLD
jgi:hypothetical protein